MLSFDFDSQDRHTAMRFAKPGQARSRHGIALKSYLDKQAAHRAAEDEVARSVEQAKQAVRHSFRHAATDVIRGYWYALASAERGLLDRIAGRSA